MLAMCNVPAFSVLQYEDYLRKRRKTMAGPLVGVVMGSKSDWGTMEHCVATLESLGIECEVRVLSAHRTPHVAAEFAQTAEARGIEVMIAAAGGAAHLAGVVASMTTLPVLGVPMVGWSLDGMDSLLATVQMPRGVPVATFAIRKAGAVNAALCAGQILGLKHEAIREAVKRDREERRQAVLAVGDPRE